MTETKDYVEHVLAHYKAEAAKHGASPASTMWDNTTRQRELDAIVSLIRHVAGSNVPSARLLEIGAGNGVLLAHLDQALPELSPVAIEFSPDMLAVAQARALPKATLHQGDVRALPFPDASFDIVVTERCVINLMDREHQQAAFSQIARVLRPGGHYICIEAFTDGHQAMNQARDELGLPAIPQAHHNLWFDKGWFKDQIGGAFEVVDLKAAPELPQENFLSSHYFVSRVLYPAVSKREPMYNTSFVGFFGFLPPSGNFSPVQLFLLKRRGA
jgi:SAM-dependent methyltransferase